MRIRLTDARCHRIAEQFLWPPSEGSKRSVRCVF
jgi:hypothetical protein